MKKHIKHLNTIPGSSRKWRWAPGCVTFLTQASPTPARQSIRGNLGAEDPPAPCRFLPRIAGAEQSESSCSRPGWTRGFCGQQLAPTLAFFQHLNRSLLRQPLSPSDTFFLPVCFPQGVPATWSRAGFVGSCPWSCGQLSPCPCLLQQMFPGKSDAPHPMSPQGRENKNSRRSRGCQLGGGCEVSKPLLDIELSWQICLPL